MSIEIAKLNAKGFTERCLAARLLRDLLSFGVIVTAILETHFVCEFDARVL